MTKTGFPSAGALLRASGWHAAVAALAMLAAPTAALAQDRDQDRGRAHWNAHSSGQSSGDRDNTRNRDNRSDRRTLSQDRPQSPPGWRGQQADLATGTNQPRTFSGDNVRRQWQGRARVSQETDARNRTYADPERNRTYSDPDRNRTYLADQNRRDENRDGWRNDRRDDWRNDNRRDNDQHGWRGPDRNNWQDGKRDFRDGDRRDWDRDRRSWDRDRRSWDRDWRRDQRYDWKRHRNTHRHVYRLGRYYAPYQNYYYRRPHIGFFLDTLFFSSRYWIADPWYYRLPAAYPPYKWVRYYDDALLVDTYSGEVVDVIYDFFW